MASRSCESIDDEEVTEEVLEKEISELRLAKKLHRLRAEKHDREKQKQTVERMIEVQSELKHVKGENDKLSDAIRKLNQSLDQAAKYSETQKLRIAELESRVAVAERELRLANAAVQARSD